MTRRDVPRTEAVQAAIICGAVVALIAAGFGFGVLVVALLEAVL